MADSMQVRDILRKVQQPQIQDTVKAIEVRADLKGIKYSESDNQLTAAVSKIPEYKLYQNISGIQDSGGKSGGSSPRKRGRKIGSIYNSQGKIHTGYYQNFKSLSEEDRKTVIVTRKKRLENLSILLSRKR